MNHTNFTDTNIDYYNCFVKPGYLAYAKDPSLIYSVCGNGVIVILHDRLKKIGGMAHCIYPKVKFSEKATNYHADAAISSLVRAMTKNGLSQTLQLDAHVFGGGSRGYAQDRAQKAIKRVRRILNKYHIRVVSEDVGGNLGRKILFNTQSGEVLILKTDKVRRTDWTPEIERQ